MFTGQLANCDHQGGNLGESINHLTITSSLSYENQDFTISTTCCFVDPTKPYSLQNPREDTGDTAPADQETFSLKPARNNFLCAAVLLRYATSILLLFTQHGDSAAVCHAPASNELGVRAVGMEGLLSTSLRKLTKRVTDFRRPSQNHNTIAAMADQEEDFSSLPLPDRFQHKVCPHPFMQMSHTSRTDKPLTRYGKSAKQRTKMQPNSLKLRQTSMILRSVHFYKIQDYGRARWRTRMLPPSRRVLLGCVHFSNSVDGKVARGMSQGLAAGMIS